MPLTHNKFVFLLLSIFRPYRARRHGWCVPRFETWSLYTVLSAGSDRPAPLSIVWKSIARRCEQNTGWKPMLLYAVAWLPWVRRRLRQDVLQRSLDSPEGNVVWASGLYCSHYQAMLSRYRC
jgi:hypothetical protein